MAVESGRRRSPSGEVPWRSDPECDNAKPREDPWRSERDDNANSTPTSLVPRETVLPESNTVEHNATMVEQELPVCVPKQPKTKRILDQMNTPLVSSRPTRATRGNKPNR